MSDPRVDAAIAHWAPRFIAQGVDYNDFVRTTARIQRWEDWCTEWQRTAADHEALARAAEDRHSPRAAADAWIQAAMCHHFGKFVFFDDMDQLRSATAATAADFARAAPLLDPPAQPVHIPYAGTHLPGYLRRPYAVHAPPVVLLIAGLDSTKEEFHTFSGLFLRRGVATLAFDGPGQGEMEFELPIEPAFERPVGAVLDWLASHTDVDAARVAAAGVSLGGYYAARAAAFEPRLACSVAMGGPYAFAPNFDDIPSLSRRAFQVRSHSVDLDQARERAAALDLDGVAERIRMPFLVVFGRQDRLIPYQHAERLYAEIASADKRLEMYEHGNHVVNNIPYAYRPLVADWVADHLYTGQAPTLRGSV
ncbi:MAG: alpha/beta fold hydrolase [Chloroflexi bacterium]|nr:alpha/beta fold hydrolase [Chloroflexota bacterium]